MYPFGTRTAVSTVATAKESPANNTKADARTRTADPFIRSVDQVSAPDTRSRAKPHESKETRSADVAAEDPNLRGYLAR
jgi:hypothetical protein